MANEMGPKSDADRLRDRLLGQWEPSRPSYLNYRKEVEAMLANQEKKLRREKRYTLVIWIYIIVVHDRPDDRRSGLLMFHGDRRDLDCGEPQYSGCYTASCFSSST